MVGRARGLARCVRSAIVHVIQCSISERVYRDETGSRASDASPALDSVRLTSHLSLITSHSVSRPHRFLDHQVIHNELAAGGSVFAHIELQERLDHVAVVD